MERSLSFLQNFLSFGSKLNAWGWRSNILQCDVAGCLLSQMYLRRATLCSLANCVIALLLPKTNWRLLSDWHSKKKKEDGQFLYSMLKNVFCAFRRDRIRREKQLLASSYPSFFMYQFSSHSSDIPKNWFCESLWKFFEKVQTWLKSGKNIGHFTCRPKNVYILIAT